MQGIIINMYPTVLKQIKEIQEIAKAEDIEFSKLKLNMQKVLDNMFVFTADELGVQRFEKILRIDNKSKSLEARKLNILSKLHQGKISLSDIRKLISEYANETDLVLDIENLELKINLTGMEKDKLLVINQIIDDFIPLNIYFGLNAHDKTKTMLYYGFHTLSGQKICIVGTNKKDVSSLNRIYVGTYTQCTRKINIYNKGEEKNVS